MNYAQSEYGFCPIIAPRDDDDDASDMIFLVLKIAFGIRNVRYWYACCAYE